MEIRPYSNQDKPLLDVFEILPEDRKFTRTPIQNIDLAKGCLLYTSPSPRD